MPKKKKAPSRTFYRNRAKRKNSIARIIRKSSFWYEQRAIHFSNLLKRELRRLEKGEQVSEARIWNLAFSSAAEGLEALRIKARMERLEVKKAISVRIYISQTRGQSNES